MGTIDQLFPELVDAGEMATRGVFPSQMIRECVKRGFIAASVPIDDRQIQPASIDLRLGPVAYRVQASFLPGAGAPVMKKVEDLMMGEVDLRRPAVFERGCVYIVPLLEELALPAGIAAKGNPKSTTGRLDVFTRLITDRGKEFERVPEGYKGPLFAEVVPRTFAIRAREGVALGQLRLLKGKTTSADNDLIRLHREEALVWEGDDRRAKPKIQDGLLVSLNLEAGDRSDVIGYRAKRNAPVIDMERVGHYDPDEFWDVVKAPRGKGIILNPGDFYILGSKERLSVPPMYAAEMVAMDPSLGEFRIHYAGFFDPGFGYGVSDVRGTPAVLEVRAHEVPFVMEDGQLVGRLVYSRLLARPEKIYGADIGSSYQRQVLALSKQFRRSTPDEG